MRSVPRCWWCHNELGKVQGSYVFQSLQVGDHEVRVHKCCLPSAKLSIKPPTVRVPQTDAPAAYSTGNYRTRPAKESDEL